MRPILLALWATAVCGCGSTSEPNKPGETDTPSQEGQWEVLREGLPGAAMSVWGTGADDVWVTGSRGDGTRPTLEHFDGSTWDSLDAGVDADLWWGFGPSDHTVWFVGHAGTVLQHDRASGKFTAIDAVTEATLFGVWGPPEGPIYAAGGIVPQPDSGGAGVLVRVVEGTAELVELPDLDPTELLFKVWGTAADDVWVIGSLGSVLHFDGTTWDLDRLEGNPRLVTISGGGPDDMVVVGGTTEGVVLQRLDAGSWEPVEGLSFAPLNGVFVHPGGTAAAAGMWGNVYERRDGIWSVLPLPPALVDFHGAWVDEKGAIYAGGGDIISLRDGVVLRYTPAP
jgi:hypothetical protein